MEFYLSGMFKQLGFNCTAYGAGTDFPVWMFLRCGFSAPLVEAWHVEEVVLVARQLDGFFSKLKLIGAGTA